MKDKKSNYISLGIVLVLVMLVVGVTYAMFSFSAAGVRENLIQSGNVAIDFKNVNTITLNDVYPLKDSVGALGTDPNSAVMSFDVVSTINGKMTVNYDLSLVDFTEGSTFTKGDVKINLKKLVGSTTSWVLGSSSTGVTIDSLSTKAGTYASLGNGGIGTGVTSFAIDSGSFSSSGTVKYTLVAWINESYQPTSTKGSSKGCSESAYTTEATCVANGGIWGDKQVSNTTDEAFSFKVQLKAVQS